MASNNNNNNTIVRAKDFDASKVTFSDVKAFGNNGGKIVYVSYGRSPLILQTPAMRAPFGVSKWENDGAPPKFTLDMSFQGMESSRSTQAFYDALEKMDARMIDDGFDNQATWFRGKKYTSKDIVEALYTPIVKHARDRDTGERTDRYAPTMKVNVPFRDGAFGCEVYDAERNKIDLRNVETKGSTVTAIVQCTGVWFVGGKYGLSFKALQLKIAADEASFRGGFAMHHGDEEHVALSPEHVDVRDAAHAAPASSSSEDEDESDYEESDVRVVDAAPIAAMVSDNAPDDDDDVVDDVVETKPKKKVYKRVMKG
jgi:hypothetical protein